MAISLPLPDWVHTVRLHDVETATAKLTELLAQAQERGRVGRGELESAASQVVEEAFEQGVRLLGLVLPPGRPAALLSCLGLELRAPMDELRAFLADRGGPEVDGLRSVTVDGVGPVVSLHRHDGSGSQAQAVLTEPDGEHWYLLTLASRDRDRGAELQRVLLDLVHGATVE